jgi:hypothetical protein
MSAPKGICTRCGETVERGHTAAYQVTGYEIERPARAGGPTTGGQNYVMDRKRVDGRIWHARSSRDCIHKWIAEKGGGGDQEPLL